MFNSKSSRLDVLIWMIISWNYREVDVKYISTEMIIIRFYLSNANLKESFLLRAQNLCYYRQLLK